MALTAEEEELLAFALGSLPSWLRGTGPDEILPGMAKQLGAAMTTNRYWLEQLRISLADGPNATDPDWLNQHARDQGTNRQDGESDDALRARLQTVADAVTRSALLDAAQEILDADGVVGAPVLLELRRDRIFLGTYDADEGTGGTFAAGATAGTFVFTPDVPFARPPLRLFFPVQEHRLLLASSDDHDGEHEITAISENGAVFASAGVQVGADADVTWRVNRYFEGEIRTTTTPSARAYLSRGYRIGTTIPTIIMILPAAAGEGTVASIREMIRQVRGAGVRAIVERPLTTLEKLTLVTGLTFSHVYVDGGLTDLVTGDVLTTEGGATVATGENLKGQLGTDTYDFTGTDTEAFAATDTTLGDIDDDDEVCIIAVVKLRTFPVVTSVYAGKQLDSGEFPGWNMFVRPDVSNPVFEFRLDAGSGPGAVRALLTAKTNRLDDWRAVVAVVPAAGLVRFASDLERAVPEERVFGLANANPLRIGDSRPAAAGVPIDGQVAFLGIARGNQVITVDELALAKIVRGFFAE